MAYPFKPMRKVRLKKLNSKREDPVPVVTFFDRPTEVKTGDAESRLNKTKSYSPIIRKVTTDNIISQSKGNSY